MGRDIELPDTELTILESIRNLLRAWFTIWLVLTILGTVGLIVLCAEILTLTTRDRPEDAPAIGAGRVVLLSSSAICRHRGV